MLIRLRNRFPVHPGPAVVDVVEAAGGWVVSGYGSTFDLIAGANPVTQWLVRAGRCRMLA